MILKFQDTNTRTVHLCLEALAYYTVEPGGACTLYCAGQVIHPMDGRAVALELERLGPIWGEARPEPVPVVDQPVEEAKPRPSPKRAWHQRLLQGDGPDPELGEPAL